MPADPRVTRGHRPRVPAQQRLPRRRDPRSSPRRHSRRFRAPPRRVHAPACPAGPPTVGFRSLGHRRRGGRHPAMACRSHPIPGLVGDRGTPRRRVHALDVNETGTSSYQRAHAGSKGARYPAGQVPLIGAHRCPAVGGDFSPDHLKRTRGMGWAVRGGMGGPLRGVPGARKSQCLATRSSIASDQRWTRSSRAANAGLTWAVPVYQRSNAT